MKACKTCSWKTHDDNAVICLYCGDPVETFTPPPFQKIEGMKDMKTDGMSDEQLREAMSLAMGFKWVVLDYGNHKERTLTKASGGHDGPADGTEKIHWNAFSEVPNYPEDLNAVHEAEKVFHRNIDLAHQYSNTLQQIVYKTKHSGTGIDFQWVNATARQRCEAFLRTITPAKDGEGR